jgi:uncharacterized membrane protein
VASAVVLVVFAFQKHRTFRAQSFDLGSWHQVT